MVSSTAMRRQASLPPAGPLLALLWASPQGVHASSCKPERHHNHNFNNGGPLAEPGVRIARSHSEMTLRQPSRGTPDPNRLAWGTWGSSLLEGPDGRTLAGLDSLPDSRLVPCPGIVERASPAADPSHFFDIVLPYAGSWWNVSCCSRELLGRFCPAVTACL